jgi:glucosamine--fructose-6-phosphate aminotransferase (isomerizing)
MEAQLAQFESEAGKYTIAEILSEPDTWNACLEMVDKSGDLEDLNNKLARNVEWLFIGCGSSFYLAQCAAASWTILTGEKARAVPASEIMLFPQLLPLPCQPVVISRSGHTSEALEAVEYLERAKNIRTLAITCGSGTPIQKLASYCVVLNPADEKSTVMTRSFTSMLLVLQALAAIRGNRQDLHHGLRALPAEAAAKLNEIHENIAALVKSQSFAAYVYLGQGPFFGIAQESMLKVLEMSCSFAQSFHTLEFRHGPKAVVSPETLVTCILSESGFDAEILVLQEMKKLGGTILAITNQATPEIGRSADYLVELSLRVPEVAQLAASVLPGQLLGFYTGLKKGLNPDEPRNLSRVVMLESNR